MHVHIRFTCPPDLTIVCLSESLIRKVEVLVEVVIAIFQCTIWLIWKDKVVTTSLYDTEHIWVQGHIPICTDNFIGDVEDTIGPFHSFRNVPWLKSVYLPGYCGVIENRFSSDS